MSVFVLLSLFLFLSSPLCPVSLSLQKADFVPLLSPALPEELVRLEKYFSRFVFLCEVIRLSNLSSLLHTTIVDLRHQLTKYGRELTSLKMSASFSLSSSHSLASCKRNDFSFCPSRSTPAQSRRAREGFQQSPRIFIQLCSNDLFSLFPTPEPPRASTNSSN